MSSLTLTLLRGGQTGTVPAAHVQSIELVDKFFGYLKQHARFLCVCAVWERDGMRGRGRQGGAGPGRDGYTQ